MKQRLNIDIDGVIVDFQSALRKEDNATLNNAKELQEYTQNMTLPLYIGENDGESKFVDLTKMVHILIGGKAETGKTKLIHTMMLSLKATKKSDELAFIVMASQEKDEAGYRAIIEDYTIKGSEIICSAGDAVRVLKGLLKELEERYSKLAEKGIRNIVGYNAQVEPMPYRVVIVDEFAPWIMAKTRGFESSLTRLAQLGRAVGIHLIASTNQCATNIVTGIIKANFPTRIAFQTEKQFESKVILDATGAERLLPQNDIYLSEGGGLIRIQTPGNKPTSV